MTVHIFCEGQSDHILSYDQQVVSDIGHFVTGSLITIFSYYQQRVSVIAHLFQRQSDHDLFLTNSE